MERLIQTQKEQKFRGLENCYFILKTNLSGQKQCAPHKAQMNDCDLYCSS